MTLGQCSNGKYQCHYGRRSKSIKARMKKKFKKKKKEKNEVRSKCLKVGRFEIEGQKERKGGKEFFKGTMAS
jgi:hypothetical protein